MSQPDVIYLRLLPMCPLRAGEPLSPPGGVRVQGQPLPCCSLTSVCCSTPSPRPCPSAGHSRSLSCAAGTEPPRTCAPGFGAHPITSIAPGVQDSAG